MFITDGRSACESFGDNPYLSDTAAATEAARDEAALPSPDFGRNLLSKAWATLGAKATLFIEKHDLGVPIGIVSVTLGAWALYESGIADSVANIIEDPVQFVDFDFPPTLQDVDHSHTYPFIFDQQPLPTDMSVRPITPEQLQ